MYSKQTTVLNATGLHARPASDFVTAAKSFESKVYVKKLGEEDTKPGNAKSILSVLAQGISINTPIEISAEGPDEVEAVDKLIELVDSKFGED